MPPEFRFPFLAGNWEDHIEDEVQLWAPLTTNPSDEPSASGSLNVTRSPGKARFQVVGRLKPTVSIGTAQNEMDTIAGRLAGEYPDSNKTLGVRVRRLDEYIAGEMRRPLLLLSLCVLLLLRSEEHTSELQSRLHLVCRLLLEKKKRGTHYLAQTRVSRAAPHSLHLTSYV